MARNEDSIPEAESVVVGFAYIIRHRLVFILFLQDRVSDRSELSLT